MQVLHDRPERFVANRHIRRARQVRRPTHRRASLRRPRHGRPGPRQSLPGPGQHRRGHSRVPGRQGGQGPRHRLGHHHQSGRLCPDQRPRHRRRKQVLVRALRQAAHPGHPRGRRPLDRPGHPEDRQVQARRSLQAAALRHARRLQPARRRRLRAGHGLPLRPFPHGHARHRLQHRACLHLHARCRRDRRDDAQLRAAHRPLHQLDPARRPHQPRQLRRAAGQSPRPGRRREHPRRGGNGLRQPQQPRTPGRREPYRPRRGAPLHHRRHIPPHPEHRHRHRRARGLRRDQRPQLRRGPSRPATSSPRSMAGRSASTSRRKFRRCSSRSPITRSVPR